MELASIEIRNFKGLKDAVLSPGSFSCLVGENNAGKSSVLQAIVAAINRQSSLNAALFYDQARPIEFIWKFTGINANDLQRIPEEHRDRIAPLVEDGAITFCSRYIAEGKLELKLISKVPRDARLRKETIDEALKGKRGAAISQAVQMLFEGRDVEIPQFGTLGEARDFIQAQIARLPAADLEPAEVALPSGIATSLGSFLPEPVYIAAVKNLGDDLKTSQATSFGKLISLLLSDLTPDLDAFERSFDELRRLLNRAQDATGEDQRHHRVRHLERRIEENLAANFPRLKVELEIPPPELKTILSSAQLYVDDGSRDLIDNKGDGVKRSLTFSILKTYVDEMEARAAQSQGTVVRRPILLLFEEPELYLHPKSQKILFQALSRISSDHQVIVTTHSPLFFAPNVTASFIRVAKEAATPKPIGRLFPVNFNLNPNHAGMFKLARFENADAAFFSRRVVLFEGDSDEHFIRHAAKLVRQNWSFDHLNIALIPVNGKGNFSKYREFFEAFNIAVSVIADLDVLFDGFEHLGASNAIQAVRDECLRELDAYLGRNPQIGREPNGKQISKRTKNPTWKERYLRLKQQVDALEEGKPVSKELKDGLSSLFAWEIVHRRLDAVQTIPEALAYMEPLRQRLQQEGIYVLRKGAIEDYYPEGAERTLAKPQRALRAVDLLTTREQLLALTTYQSNGGQACEFEEFLGRIFEGVDA